MSSLTALAHSVTLTVLCLPRMSLSYTCLLRCCHYLVSTPWIIEHHNLFSPPFITFRWSSQIPLWLQTQDSDRVADRHVRGPSFQEDHQTPISDEMGRISNWTKHTNALMLSGGYTVTVDFKRNMEIVLMEVSLFLHFKGREVKRNENFDVSLFDNGLTYTLKIRLD